MFSLRCLHGHEHGVDAYQCGLSKGHAGPHKSKSALDADHRRNMNPTLDDIRQVVREEVRAALQSNGDT